ncbi:unnamed protein product [Phaeothamnion confervicola]
MKPQKSPQKRLGSRVTHTSWSSRAPAPHIPRPSTASPASQNQHVTRMASSSTTRATVQAALLGALCLRHVAADFNSGCNPVFAHANMDPIASAGVRSSHAHHISGTTGFSPDTIKRRWMQNNDSTCDMPGDFSNYWTPVLYRTDLGSTPTVVPVNHRAYYSYDAKYPIDPKVFGTPFPMILGSAAGLSASQLEGLYPAIIFLVEQPGDGNPQRSENIDNFQDSATDADMIEINYNFPPCWDGVSRAFSGTITERTANNLAYPPTTDGPCPASHPVRIPEGKIAARCGFACRLFLPAAVRDILSSLSLAKSVYLWPSFVAPVGKRIPLLEWHRRLCPRLAVAAARQGIGCCCFSVTWQRNSKAAPLVAEGASLTTLQAVWPLACPASLFLLLAGTFWTRRRLGATATLPSSCLPAR